MCDSVAHHMDRSCKGTVCDIISVIFFFIMTRIMINISSDPNCRSLTFKIRYVVFTVYLDMIINHSCRSFTMYPNCRSLIIDIYLDKCI